MALGVSRQYVEVLQFFLQTCHLQEVPTVPMSTIRSCFITAPSGSNLHVLTKVLHDRGIRVEVPQPDPVGPEVGAELANAIASADLIIGILSRERRSEWVLFELGQAYALGKRILLFAPPNSGHLPSNLSRFLTVRANPSNREAIEFALDQVLAASQPSTKPPYTKLRSPSDESRPLGATARDYLDQSQVLSLSGSAKDLEDLIGRALDEAGVETLVASDRREQRADLAVWSDALQPSIGNPLLVEVKSSLRGPTQTREATKQLSDYVSAAGSRWGLLIFGEGPEKRLSLPPNVLAISASDLFRELETRSFESIIRGLRNRRVHGGME